MELVVATAAGIVCLYAVVVGTVEARGLKKKMKCRAYSVEKLMLIHWRGGSWLVRCWRYKEKKCTCWERWGQ